MANHLPTLEARVAYSANIVPLITPNLLAALQGHDKGFNVQDIIVIIQMSDEKLGVAEGLHVLSPLYDIGIAHLDERFYKKDRKFYALTISDKTPRQQLEEHYGGSTDSTNADIQFAQQMLEISGLDPDTSLAEQVGGTQSTPNP